MLWLILTMIACRRSRASVLPLSVRQLRMLKAQILEFDRRITAWHCSQSAYCKQAAQISIASLGNVAELLLATA